MTNVKYTSANFDGNMYLQILHLPRVELHCKLQEKLHRVTRPLETFLDEHINWKQQIIMFIIKLLKILEL